MSYLLLALLWIIWGAIHSGMCSITATEFFKRWLGTLHRFYRLLFNLVAIATIIPVVLYAHSIEGDVLLRWEGVLSVFQALLLTLAGLVWLAGARHYDMLQFVGFRQVMTGVSRGVLSQTGEFDTTGILGVIRHPWYLATLLFVWAHNRSMTKAVLITNVVLTVYLAVGIVLEERKLLLEFGEEYRKYQARVSALVPFRWLKLRIPRSHVLFSHRKETQDDSSVLQDSIHP